MFRNLPLLLMVGSLALSACNSKKTPQATGSLLGTSTTTADEEAERERERGVQNEDVTQGRGTDMPTKRLPR